MCFVRKAARYSWARGPSARAVSGEVFSQDFEASIRVGDAMGARAKLVLEAGVLCDTFSFSLEMRRLDGDYQKLLAGDMIGASDKRRHAVSCGSSSSLCRRRRHGFWDVTARKTILAASASDEVGTVSSCSRSTAAGTRRPNDSHGQVYRLALF